MKTDVGLARPEFPKTLYRFLSPSGEPEENEMKFWPDLENAIHKERHYMASLSQQNDPFEARPSFTRSKFKDIRDYLRRFEATFGKGRSFTGTDIASELQARGVTAKHYQNLVGHSLEVAKNVSKIVHAPSFARRATKIKCFSEEWTNLLMWSHYGNGHQGICLCYNIDGTQIHRIGPVQVDYVTERPKLSTVEMMEFVGHARLKHENAQFFDTDRTTKTFEKLFLTKAKDWTYEKEWRISHIDDDPPGYRDTPGMKVVEILVGKNADAKLLTELQTRHGHHVKITQLKLDNDKFALCPKC